ncbi:MAG: DNA-binding protein [Actinomycetota bacterium]|nr:DNA-binding protein [Actinomycetota bacterium]
MAMTQDTERGRVAQVEMYGEALGDLIRRVAGRLGLTQSRTATTLGVSPAMLSQLMSGQRVKIGNPAVLERLHALVALGDQASSQQLEPGDLDERLEHIRRSAGLMATASTARRQAAAQEVVAIQALFRAVGSAGEIEAASQLLEADHPRLGEFLRVYGVGPTDEAVAHFERVRHRRS